MSASTQTDIVQAAVVLAVLEHNPPAGERLPNARFVYPSAVYGLQFLHHANAVLNPKVYWLNCQCDCFIIFNDIEKYISHEEEDLRYAYHRCMDNMHKAIKMSLDNAQPYRRVLNISEGTTVLAASSSIAEMFASRPNRY